MARIPRLALRLLIAVSSVPGWPQPADAQAARVADADSAITALVGVNILPMTGGGTLTGQTIVVAAGQVSMLGPRDSIAVPEDSRVLDLSGRWVMPGLVDMHVHIFSRDELALYLDAGITAVSEASRRMRFTPFRTSRVSPSPWTMTKPPPRVISGPTGRDANAVLGSAECR